MDKSAADFVKELIFFLVLVNPISKIFVLSLMSREATAQELRRAALTSSGLAWVLLLLFAAVGSAVLTSIFHVQIYALELAGGTILFIIGLHALNKGRFFELDEHTRLQDLSLAPLGSPMIAGPATITASISETAVHGFPFVAVSLTMALVVNLLLMLLSPRLGQWLSRFHLMGPLIRITGFLVAGIAAQMALSGLGQWLQAVKVWP